MAQCKNVYVYWDSGYENSPLIVKKCIEKWRELEGERVILLTSNNLSEYVPSDVYSLKDSLTSQIFSDLVRLYKISRGGIWADATLYPCINLEEWLPSQPFFAFRAPGRDRPVASWFLAAEQNSYIANLTYRYFLETCKTIARNDAKAINPNLKFCKLWNWNRLLPIVAASNQFVKKTGWYPYYSLHYTFSKAILFDSRSRAEFRTLTLPKASKILQFTGLNDANLELQPVYKLNWRWGEETSLKFIEKIERKIKQNLE